MTYFQDYFDKVIKEETSFQKVATELIRRKFDQVGVRLRDDQISSIERQLANLDRDSFLIQIDDNQLTGFASTGEFEGDKLTLDLSESEDELISILEERHQAFSDLIPEMISKFAPTLLEDLKTGKKRILRRDRKSQKRLEKRIRKLWGDPLDLLEMMISLCIEAGSDFNDSFRAGEIEEKPLVIDVVTRLHARACHVAQEVLVLIRSGFADGAHARWRSLHELAVTAFFISKHGESSAIRYMNHNVIESYQAARLERKYAHKLGYEPLNKDEFDQIESSYKDLLETFGKSYKSQYGWAAIDLDNNRPTFRDIEEDSGLDQLRPYYKLASHNVHANPKGILFRLGLYSHMDNILLAGPTDMGFADPGQGAAISLAQITSALLTLDPNIYRLVQCQVLFDLEREIGERLVDIQSELEEGSVAKY